MFGTQKEKLKSKLNPNRETPERQGQGAGAEQTQHARDTARDTEAQHEHGWAHSK